MRGQGSLELILVVAIVVVVAVLVFVSYAEESQRTVVEATIRSQAELALAKSAVERPGCASAALVNITRSGSSSAVTYKISVLPASCGAAAFPAAGCANCRQIQGRLTEALGCAYDEGGACKGKIYNVVG